MTPDECLTVHGGDVIPCLLNPNVVSASPVAKALLAASRSNNVSLVNVQPLFCTSQRCPLTVWTPSGVYLTHYDQYHMDKFYSAFVATALQQLLSTKIAI
jgi:hypothetical protein